MDCEKTRIIQVSLSKITDSRRRRGGSALRRNLLVSHVLNSVLTSSDSAYCTYRTKVEIDIDMDSVENEVLPFDKAKVTLDASGEPMEAGNAAHTMRSAVNSNEKVTEMELNCDKHSTKETVGCAKKKDLIGKQCSGHEEGKRSELTTAAGSKRSGSHYGNEPCDSHAVQKRRKVESDSEALLTDCEHYEPMDVSGLVGVFSASFTGLCSVPRNASSISSNLDSFHYLPTVQPVGCTLGWPQTIVEAF